MGGFGKGATPHTADVHGGSGGVGMRNSFPWVDAEPPVMHLPVNVFRLEYGPGASVAGHCVGAMATLRAVETWNWPSVFGACGIHSEFGLGAEPNPLLRKVPIPRSR